MELKDYTVEFCPWCCEEVVIHAAGITASGPLLCLL